jgi:hypothetical protein
MDVQVHRTLMTRIERIDAYLFGFCKLAGSALAYGVRRVLAALHTLRDFGQGHRCF